jgi:hypothetical protein
MIRSILSDNDAIVPSVRSEHNHTALAGIPYNRFLREVHACRIVIFENEEFLDELAFLADAFDSPSLQAALNRAGSA